MQNDLFGNGTPTPASGGDAENTQHPQHTPSNTIMQPPYRHNAPKGTSEIAAKMIAARTPTQRARIYRAILASETHGLTDDEGETQLDIFAASYSARRGELAKLGLIRDTGNRRLTQRGCPAAVWVAVGQHVGGEA
jgi:hypothetical protein